MSGAGRIVQLSVSNGGVPKRAVEAARVTALGLEGDAHRDTEHHGGPEGGRLLLGAGVLLEVTRYTSPCVNIAPAFAGRDYARVSQKRHPGWSRVYARVLVSGALRRGDSVRLVDELGR